MELLCHFVSFLFICYDNLSSYHFEKLLLVDDRYAEFACFFKL